MFVMIRLNYGYMFLYRNSIGMVLLAPSSDCGLVRACVVRFWSSSRSRYVSNRLEASLLC